MDETVAADYAAASLRQARLAARLTQRDLAARAGVPQSTVARVESGARQPTVPMWARLLQAAGAAPAVAPAPAATPQPANQRARWSAPVEVPDDLTQLRAPTTGRVRLPGSVYSSGAGPDRVFDLEDEQQRIRVYQIVLTNGSVDDLHHYLNLNELLRLWPKLWLAPHVRRAWADRIPTSGGAA